jgi:hypothetical protein
MKKVIAANLFCGRLGGRIFLDRYPAGDTKWKDQRQSFLEPFQDEHICGPADQIEKSDMMELKGRTNS